MGFERDFFTIMSGEINRENSLDTVPRGFDTPNKQGPWLALVRAESRLKTLGTPFGLYQM